MLIGYARVSTHEQNLDLQLDALKVAGCGKIFTDKISSLKEERKGLLETLEYVRPGDVLVVWKLDRLGRTLKQLIELVAFLNQKGIGFKSLKETIDTTTSTGKLVFHIFAALEAARARGRSGGRPKSLPPQQVEALKKLYDNKTMPVSQICSTFHIGRTTLYRYIKVE